MTESAAASYPERVRAAMSRAAAAAFELSSEPAVGRAIMTLAAAVRQGGRILEIGTGLGVGTAWLVEGLETRPDVELVTIECDPQRAALAAQAAPAAPPSRTASFESDGSCSPTIASCSPR